jgi:hypothetical protein
MGEGFTHHDSPHCGCRPILLDLAEDEAWQDGSCEVYAGEGELDGEACPYCVVPAPPH